MITFNLAPHLIMNEEKNEVVPVTVPPNKMAAFYTFFDYVFQIHTALNKLKSHAINNLSLNNQVEFENVVKKKLVPLRETYYGFLHYFTQENARIPWYITIFEIFNSTEERKLADSKAQVDDLVKLLDELFSCDIDQVYTKTIESLELVKKIIASTR